MVRAIKIIKNMIFYGIPIAFIPLNFMESVVGLLGMAARLTLMLLLFATVNISIFPPGIAMLRVCGFGLLGVRLGEHAADM